MVKILGILDLTAAALLLAVHYNVEIPNGLITTIAVCLIVKAIIFLMDFTSLVDLAAGILLIVSLSATLPSVIVLPIALFVGLKGIMSLPAV